MGCSTRTAVWWQRCCGRFHPYGLVNSREEKVLLYTTRWLSDVVQQGGAQRCCVYVHVYIRFVAFSERVYVRFVLMCGQEPNASIPHNKNFVKELTLNGCTVAAAAGANIDLVRLVV